MNEARLLKLMKALADGNRLRMVQTVAAAGELSCGEIAERFPIAQATVSHHLKILVDSEILAVRREGQFAYFTVNRAVASELGVGLAGLLPELAAASGRSTARAR